MLMEVVPAGRSPAMEMVVRFVVLPGQVRLNFASAQVFAAPGNNGAFDAAIAVVTVIPLIVVGAVFVHDH